MADYQVVHHDERLVVLNKPAGLLSVRGIGPQNRDCLADRVAAQLPGARIVHRLDRETSGVMVMGLDARAHRELSRQFETREVFKSYVAVVAGRLEEEAGVIDLPLRKDLDNPPRHMVDARQGRAALTRWRVLATEGGRSRLELRPETGRSHQLRLHLRAIGHPILGDDLYAPDEIAALVERMMLHASVLSFRHPSTGAMVTFEAPCPF